MVVGGFWPSSNHLESPLFSGDVVSDCNCTLRKRQVKGGVRLYGALYVRMDGLVGGDLQGIHPPV